MSKIEQGATEFPSRRPPSYVGYLKDAAFALIGAFLGSIIPYAIAWKTESEVHDSIGLSNYIAIAVVLLICGFIVHFLIWLERTQAVEATSNYRLSQNRHVEMLNAIGSVRSDFQRHVELFYYAPSPDDAATPAATPSAFETCITAAKGARSRLLVISPYFPRNRPAVAPAMREHNNYLAAGIEEALKAHIGRPASQDGRPSMRYTRMIQLHEEELPRIRNGLLPRDLIRDPGLRDHLEKVFELRHKPGADFELRVFAREFSASLPSTLIVDESHLFFSLPTNRGESDTYDCVMEVQDTSTALIQRMVSVFNTFDRGGIFTINGLC